MFQLFEILNHFIWSHVAFLLIMVLGLYFSFFSRFFQIWRIGGIFRSFFAFFGIRTTDKRGIHPLKTFFAAIGGCIGIGNVVGICTAVEIGGPGALFWTWIGGLFGMLIQYAEVYLGLKYRIKNEKNNYDGGPMYFLPLAYKISWIAPLFCILFCIYGVEIFMFNVMASSMSINWGVNFHVIVVLLLIATIGVALGGIKRVGEVCSAIIPFFILVFFAMCLWVLLSNLAEVPSVFASIFKGAFSSQAAQGAFAGSTVSLAISMGLSRGAYSGDIGIGYNSIIYAEAQTKEFQKLSSLTIIGIFLDTFVISTLSILIILSTGVWKSDINVSFMVQQALSLHFPYMQHFMPFFLFLLGFTTILAYFTAGVKCAKFLSPKWGPLVYYAYASFSLPTFAYVDTHHALNIMSFAGAILLTINLVGIFLLRKRVIFGLDEE